MTDPLVRPARIAALLVALTGFGAGAVVAVSHPVAPMLVLAVFYTVCLGAMWRPGLWLFAVPACLPVLNFSPWTGWLVVDEFDLLLMAVLTGGYGRLALGQGRSAPSAGGMGRWLPVAVCLAGAVALWRGLASAEPMALGWFQGYTDPLNSVRVFKSLLWAGLCVPLLQDALRHSPGASSRRIAGGMAAGLACVTLAVLWERLAFPGLTDFTSKYRITALFWEMHVGGAAIDGYLALSAPFVVWALRSARGPAGWLAAALLAVLATYASLTTFSRGVYLAVAAPLLLLGGLFWLQARGLDALALSRRFWQRLRPSTWRAKAGWVLVVTLGLEVVGVLHGGTYMADRVAATDRDFGSRMAHWQRGLSLLHTPTEWVLGQGLGRLPALYSSTFAEGELSGQARLRGEAAADGASRQFVTVSGPPADPELGGLFALTQRIPVEPGELYRVRIKLRITEPTEVHLLACERHLLYNGRCQGGVAQLRPAAAAWQELTLPFQGRPLRGGPWYAPRPAMFSMSVASQGAAVDVERMALLGRDGRDRLLNGDFTHALAHWFPAAQTYFLPWHIDNLYLEALIERGLLGLLLLVALLACALWRLVLGRARHHALAPYLAASLWGGLLVGLVSSVLDVPRVAFLLFWLAFLSLQLVSPQAGADHKKI